MYGRSYPHRRTAQRTSQTRASSHPLSSPDPAPHWATRNRPSTSSSQQSPATGIEAAFPPARPAQRPSLSAQSRYSYSYSPYPPITHSPSHYQFSASHRGYLPPLMTRSPLHSPDTGAPIPGGSSVNGPISLLAEVASAHDRLPSLSNTASTRSITSGSSSSQEKQYPSLGYNSAGDGVAMRRDRSRTSESVNGSPPPTSIRRGRARHMSSTKLPADHPLAGLNLNNKYAPYKDGELEKDVRRVLNTPTLPTLPMPSMAAAAPTSPPHWLSHENSPYDRSRSPYPSAASPYASRNASPHAGPGAYAYPGPYRLDSEQPHHWLINTPLTAGTHASSQPRPQVAIVPDEITDVIMGSPHTSVVCESRMQIDDSSLPSMRSSTGNRSHADSLSSAASAPTPARPRTELASPTYSAPLLHIEDAVTWKVQPISPETRRRCGLIRKADKKRKAQNALAQQRSRQKKRMASDEMARELEEMKSKFGAIQRHRDLLLEELGYSRKRKANDSLSD